MLKVSELRGDYLNHVDIMIILNIWLFEHFKSDKQNIMRIVIFFCSPRSHDLKVWRYWNLLGKLYGASTQRGGGLLWGRFLAP